MNASHSFTIRRCLCCVALLASAVSAARAEDATASTLAPRVWFLGWKFGEVDYGNAPMAFVNYTTLDRDWYLQVLAGYGQGWETDARDELERLGIDTTSLDTTTSEAERLDLQALVGRALSLKGLEDRVNLPFTLGHLFAGAGYHYIGWTFDSPLGEAETWYQGPELMLGILQPTAIRGLNLRATATYSPVIWYEGEAPAFDVRARGTTRGYLLDGGLAYQIPAGRWATHLAAGYRQQRVQPRRPEFERDALSGFYVEAGINW